jgi:hypothetical protein
MVIEKRTAPELVHVCTHLAGRICDRSAEVVFTEKSLSFDERLGRVSQERDHLGKVNMRVVFAVFSSRPVKQTDVF